MRDRVREKGRVKEKTALKSSERERVRERGREREKTALRSERERIGPSTISLDAGKRSEAACNVDDDEDLTVAVAMTMSTLAIIILSLVQSNLKNFMETNS